MTPDELKEAVARVINPNWDEPAFWPEWRDRARNAARTKARAAIAVCLEQAAKECTVQMPLGDDAFTEGYRLACEENARNIRALIGKEGQ